MASPSTAILYCYGDSPFAEKIALVLTFKKILTLFLLLSSQSAFKTVTVERMPPRPALQKLGLNYRRIPVLAIDGDIILDTSLMVEELEKRFTVKDGFKTLWPGNTAALAPLALQASRFVGDKPIFKAIGALLPASVFSDDTFRKDREFFNGANINPKKLKTLAPMFLSLLQHHMTDLEKQLKASEGEFLLGNQPSYADISFYWLLAVIRNAHRDDQDSLVTELFSQDLRRKSYIKVIEWMKLMDQVFEKLSYYGPSPGPDSSLGGQKIDSEEAQRLLESGKRVERMVDEHEALVANGWFKKGDEVIVTPDDTGKTHPQSGILIGLTPETGTLEVKTSRNKSLHVHFPRHGYVIAKKPKNSKL